MNTPLLDLAAQHAPIRDEIGAAIARVVDSGRYVGGPEVETFEREFADWCGASHCVGTSSGTSALTLALRAAGIGRCDEVITTAMTFIATQEAIVEAGAKPVLVDPEPDTALLSADAVAAAIGPKTAAIVAVDLYGQPVDLEAFGELARKHGLLFAEDAAQAHGASWNDLRVGSAADVATFSFFPGKNLGALGDAGALTTNDAALADRARRLADHGRLDKHNHAELGTNARLDPMQAAVLGVKLPHLTGWNEGRRRQAAAYDELLAGVDGVEPVAVAPEATHVYHQYVVRLEDRDGAAALLSERGIATGIHYPVPINRQPAMAELTNTDDFPNADAVAATVLSLPVFPELTDEQRERVAGGLAEHAGKAVGSAR
jgi:dTDP-4-amino-4,6-dideoxygalactose transaminase